MTSRGRTARGHRETPLPAASAPGFRTRKRGPTFRRIALQRAWPGSFGSQGWRTRRTSGRWLQGPVRQRESLPLSLAQPEFPSCAPSPKSARNILRPWDRHQVWNRAVQPLEPSLFAETRPSKHIRVARDYWSQPRREVAPLGMREKKSASPSVVEMRRRRARVDLGDRGGVPELPAYATGRFRQHAPWCRTHQRGDPARDGRIMYLSRSQATQSFTAKVRDGS